MLAFVIAFTFSCLFMLVFIISITFSYLFMLVFIISITFSYFVMLMFIISFAFSYFFTSVFIVSFSYLSIYFVHSLTCILLCQCSYSYISSYFLLRTVTVSHRWCMGRHQHCKNSDSVTQVLYGVSPTL